MGDDGDSAPAGYFVIFVKSEESYSTVASTDVVYGDNVAVGDEVTFFWNKDTLQGEVCFMHGEYSLPSPLQCLEPVHKPQDSCDGFQPSKVIV